MSMNLLKKISPHYSVFQDSNPHPIIYPVAGLLKVSKSRKQLKVSWILPKKQMKLTILSKEDAQYNEFRLFFGRIHETITCFRDLLTFSWRH